MDELATRRRGRHSVDPIILEALAGGASHVEAARAANVSVRTITRRLADPSFRAQINEIHARSLGGVAADLAASAARAVTTLVELNSADQPPTVRVNAARALLSMYLQYQSATEAREESAQPADEPGDLAAAKQRASELVAELVKKREMHFKSSQNSGHAPPNLPSCIMDHAPGECDNCRAWQDTAHAIVVEHGVDPEGCLTDAGERVRDRVWPLRPATIHLLNVALARRNFRSASAAPGFTGADDQPQHVTIGR